MKDTNIPYPEDDEWSQEDIEKFAEAVSEEDREIATGGGDKKPPVHPGAFMVGIFLSFLIIYSLYAGEMQFASLNSILLVLLALGSKAIE